MTATLVALCATACGLPIGACGGSDEGPKTTSSAAAAARQRAAERQREAAAAKRKAAACKAKMGPLLDALDELDSRLGIGLSYVEYRNQVGDVKVAYDRVFTDGPPKDFDCLQGVGLPAEAALNQYAKAVNTWSACFDAVDCSNDEVKPKLQARWSKAGAQLRRAKAALTRMSRGSA